MPWLSTAAPQRLSPEAAGAPSLPETTPGLKAKETPSVGEASGGLGLASHPHPEAMSQAKLEKGPGDERRVSPGTLVRERLLGQGRPSSMSHTGPALLGVVRHSQWPAYHPPWSNCTLARLAHSAPCQLPWITCQKSPGPWAKCPWTETATLKIPFRQSRLESSWSWEWAGTGSVASN